MNNNERTVTVRIQRRELIDLMLACAAIAEETEAGKWTALHGKLSEILNKFDEENGISVYRQKEG